MNHKKLSLLFLIIIVLSSTLVAFQAAAETEPEVLELIDGLGRAVTIELPVEKIVSLAPSNTEILFAVGAVDMVVGVTEYCNFPEEALEIEKVGGFSADTMSVETIVSLEPDVVFAYGDRQGDIITALEELDITVYVLYPSDMIDVFFNIFTVGQITGNEEQAEAVITDMEDRTAAVVEAVAEIEEDEKVLVFWEIFDEPLMTTGPATFIGQLIEMAGGVNIFADLEGEYLQINAEEVIARDPQAIMGSDTHGEKLTPEMIGARPGWDQIDAVKNERILLIPGDIVSRAGPRLADAVEAIALALYPELFE